MNERVTNDDSIFYYHYRTRVHRLQSLTPADMEVPVTLSRCASPEYSSVSWKLQPILSPVSRPSNDAQEGLGGIGVIIRGNLWWVKFFICIHPSTKIEHVVTF